MSKSKPSFPKWVSEVPQWARDALVIAVGIGAFLWLATTAHCQPACAPELAPDARKVIMEHRGVTGTWVHPKLRKCELRILKSMGASTQVIGLLHERLELQESQLHELMAVTKLSEEQGKDLTEALMNASQEQSRAESFLKSDVLWFSIGLVAGGTVLYLAMR